MAPCQVSSVTKVAKTAAPAIGRGGAATCDWVPRPPRSTEVFEPDVPRSKVGFNEYMYALSRRHPAAVWCASAALARLLARRGSCALLMVRGARRTIVGRAAGRGRNCRWELDPIAAGLRTLHVKLHQQYESPAAVMELVRRV